MIYAGALFSLLLFMVSGICQESGDTYWDDDKPTAASRFFLMLASVVMTASLLLGWTRNPEKTHTWELESTTPIAVMADSTGAHGQFVLGTGTVETDMYYFYYTKKGDGYVSGKLKADGVTIYTQDGAPRIETWVCVPTKEARLWDFQPCNYGHKYKIIVPEGSITPFYQFDAQ